MLSSKQISQIKEQAYSGLPSKLPNVCLVYPGMMKDMLEMGSLEYSARLNLLLMDESNIEEIVKEKGGNIKEVEGMTPL